MPGLWEFPGGKCEVGETPSQASKRECREEVGVEVVIGRLRRVTTHQYAHGFIELQYFDASTLDPRAEPDPNSGFVWVPASNLDQYTFPEANEPIIAELMGSWES